MLRVEVNGQEVSLTWDGPREWGVLMSGIQTDLDGRGWVIESVTVDGVPLSDPLTEKVDLEDGKPHHVAVTAAPTAGGLQKLLSELVATLPRFKAAFSELGEKFAQGSWRDGLGTLDPLLEELRLVAHGFESLKIWERQGKSSSAELNPILQQLAQGVEKKSWVEVSDLLLYELEPLLEEWENLALAVE